MTTKGYTQGLSSLVRPFASQDFRLSSQASGNLDVQSKVGSVLTPRSPSNFGDYLAV
jgi:hypothetical protein